MSKALYRLFLRKLTPDIHGIAFRLDEYPPVTCVVLEAEREHFRRERADLLGRKIHDAADKGVQQLASTT